MTVDRDEARRRRVEAAAIALYENTRGYIYSGAEWDWPNIDKSYDRDDQDEPDPEWLRNRYRSDARAALDAADAAGPGLLGELDAATTALATLRPIFDYWWNKAETLELSDHFMQISKDDSNAMDELCLAADRVLGVS